jgi:membrane protease YdiL (CAAX protease family)
VSESLESRPKVRPRIWIGLVIWLTYVVVVFAIQIASGVPYDEWGESADNLFLGAGISTVLLAVTTSLLGWWRPALFDRARSRHLWPIFIPILAAVAGVMNLAGTDWTAYSGAFFAASLALLLVGFTEEIVNRGLLLVGLRSRLAEGWVWFITSALFALMHFINVLLGAPVAGTMTQVFTAFLGGTIFYILRRTTGSLIWPMLLHGFWDFSVFAAGVGQPGDIVSIATVLYLATGILSLLCVVFVIRGANERLDVAAPAGTTAADASESAR